MTENKSYADSFRIRTNSFRIRNYENQLASVWQIGSGDFFAVKFDEDDEPLIYTKENVANAFNNMYWEIAFDDAVEEELKSFKYYHIDEGQSYVNTWHSDGTTTLWDGKVVCYWDAERAKDFIRLGAWIVVSDNTNIEPVMDNPDIIQRIKSATKVYDMTISVDGGTYHIYDNLCDISYKADTDEKLIKILDCVDYLSEQVA